VRGTWRRRIAVIIPAVCALILLPVATNIATGALPDFITRNRWLSWVGVVVFGMIAVFLSELFPPDPPGPTQVLDNSSGAPSPEPDPTSRNERQPSPDPDNPEPPSHQAAPLETVGVVIGANHPGKVRGRDSLLRKLERRLSKGGLVVLVGPGGAGKSTVARELIRQIRPPGESTDQPPAWEVTGAVLRKLVDGLHIVAQNLGASATERDAIKSLRPAGPDCLWRALERGPAGWILIIDNADHTEYLAKPAGPSDENPPQLADGTGWARAGRQGLVIVTSRQRDRRFWPPAAIVEPVGLLPIREAARILRDLAKDAGTFDQAKALAHRLGRLPLALHLAGRYLGDSYAVYETFDAYREALESDPTAIKLLELHHKDPEAGDRMRVMLTWELSLDALAKHGLPEARPLLRLLSCYAPAVPIPVSLLRPDLVDPFLTSSIEPRAALEATGPRMNHVLQGLDRLGLIDRVGSPGRRGLIVHPVVCDTNRTYLLEPRPNDPPELPVRQTALRLLVAALDDLANERPSTWPEFRVLEPHLQALLVNSAPRLGAAEIDTLIRVAGNTGSAYGHMGSPDFGIELITSAFAHQQRLGIDASPTISMVRQQLARLLGRVGRHLEAEHIFRDLFTTQQRDWPDDDLANLVARHNLAVAIGNRGAWAEAVSAFRRLLDDEKRVLGSDHRTTLTTRMQYATLLGQLDRWSDAETHLADVVDDATRALGKDDRLTLVARHNLAQAVRRQGREEEAESAIHNLVEDERQAIEIGDDHLITAATSRHGDGGLLTLFQPSTPALHEQFAIFLFNKGMAMGEEYRDKAVEAFDELITRFAEDTSPKIHELVGKAMFRKAATLRELKLPEKAADAFTQMAGRHADDPSADMRELAATAMFRKAVILGELDRTEEAAAAYDELIEHFYDDRSTVPRELVAMAFHNRAIAIRHKSEQAVESVKQAITRYEQLAADDPNAFEERLASARRLLDQINSIAAAAMFDRAVRLEQNGHYEEALAAYDEIYSRFCNSPSPTLRELAAKAQFNKAAILDELGRSEDETDT
jgi:tetratricopeptide (TPR) repeat protein